MQVSITTYTEAPVADVEAALQLLYPHQAPHWQPAPHHDVCFVVYDHDRVQACAIGYLNPYMPAYYIIGNYECTTSAEAATALWAAVEQRARSCEKPTLLGPMHGATWYPYRFQVPPIRPFFTAGWHPPYYIAQWQAAGFVAEAHYYTNRELLQPGRVLPDATAFFEQKGWILQSLNIDDALPQLVELHQFCQLTFAHNHLFSPISAADFVALYRPLLPFLDPRLVMLVYEERTLVGFFLAIADPYQPQQAIAKTIARHPDDKYKGMMHHLSAYMYARFLEMGFTTLLHAYIHESNSSQRVSANYGGTLYQTHILLKKSLC